MSGPSGEQFKIDKLSRNVIKCQLCVSYVIMKSSTNKSLQLDFNYLQTIIFSSSVLYKLLADAVLLSALFNWHTNRPSALVRIFKDRQLALIIHLFLHSIISPDFDLPQQKSSQNIANGSRKRRWSTRRKNLRRLPPKYSTIAGKPRWK